MNSEVKVGTPSSTGKAVEFLSGCKDELGKVSRPTKQQTIQATLVTLVIMVVVSLSLAMMDLVFKYVMKAVL